MGISKQRQILIVEDDSLQYRIIRHELKRRGLLTSIQIIRWQTEEEFFRRFEEIIARPPVVIILDIMLRWTTADRNSVPPPPDVDANGYYRAGFRCLRHLRANPNTENIPVIVYTILDTNELEKEWDILAKGPKPIFLGKEFDSDLERKIRTLIS